MKGRRKVLFWWVLCVSVVLLAVFGFRGSHLRGNSQLPHKQTVVQRMMSTSSNYILRREAHPFENLEIFMVRPDELVTTLGFEVSSPSPATPPAISPNRESAVSPTQEQNQYNYSVLTPSEGPPSGITIPETMPPTTVVAPSVQPSPPSNDVGAASPIATQAPMASVGADNTFPPSIVMPPSARNETPEGHAEVPDKTFFPTPPHAPAPFLSPPEMLPLNPPSLLPNPVNVAPPAAQPAPWQMVPSSPVLPPSWFTSPVAAPPVQVPKQTIYSKPKPKTGPNAPAPSFHGPVHSQPQRSAAASRPPDGQKKNGRFAERSAFAPIFSPSHNPGSETSPAVASPPRVIPAERGMHYAPTPIVEEPFAAPVVSQTHAPTSIFGDESPSPSPISNVPIAQRNNKPFAPPPFSRPFLKPKAPWVFPPPPPNLGCTPIPCAEPLTNSPPGLTCICVLPIKVGLRLDVALYTFFPLVSELAQEIASGTFMKQSQVRVMGANAADEDPNKTIILVDLVPLRESFDYSTALQTSDRFWRKKVAIKFALFGDYEVLYVVYPGLPPSPPTTPKNINTGYGAFGSNSAAMKPLGADITKKKEKLSGGFIAIMVISPVIVLVLCGSAWILLLKYRGNSHQHVTTPQSLLPSFSRSSGFGCAMIASRFNSGSLSSSLAACATASRAFSLADIERATNRFDESRLIGEGGFGRVYEGALEDGTRVAVKVLKRDDHQGGREFIVEVEMLSRLHHRNLVKLIGICTEERARCLVYELIPNGSVESHLHGSDKEASPLDWSARIKIALGSARGLAYLHEDSTPRIIHRDFKSSNILLEHDFTPKVSDFGLARAALKDGDEHISTRVMGTFGYVAPEYAMTGHLLVKSDVYSYGVVLLELLTGRKPVDMLQPPGQENLVAWARPLLTSKVGIKTIMDPALEAPFDSVAKVAAIASMCVQSEVSHRPYMGVVVQALKLVCNYEGDSDDGWAHGGQEDDSPSDQEAGGRNNVVLPPDHHLEAGGMISVSDLFSRPREGFAGMEAVSDSLRRHSCSGPLIIRTRRLLGICP